MPRHRYKYFEVTCLEPKRFSLDRMRDAVDYLKSLPPSDFIGLTAVMETYRSAEFGFRFGGRPMLRLDQITGKTPVEVWAAFDAEADRQIRGLEKRFTPAYKTQS